MSKTSQAAIAVAIAEPEISDEEILSWVNGATDPNILKDEIERMVVFYEIPMEGRQAFRDRVDLLLNTG